VPRPPHSPTEVADALIGVAPLVSRWIERLLAGHEPPLTLAQFLALRSISRDGVGGSQLARQTGVSSPAVSQLMTALTAAGLLERRAEAGDRRRQTLRLTATGRRVLRSAEMLLRKRLNELLAGLPPPEADALARLLPRVEDALAGRPPPPRPKPPPPPPR